MKRRTPYVLCLLIAMLAVTFVQSQSTSSTGEKSSMVPNFVKFSGTVKDVMGKPLAGIVGVTFALYQQETGGAALWMETQNVQADASGHYNVSLGAGKALPSQLFASGEARWLGVQVSGQIEQNRILLLSVPYALKAADAETVGGLLPSAFVLAAPPSGGNGSAATAALSSGPSAGGPAALAGTGTTNFLPLWTNSTTLGNSALFQTAGKVGIGTTTPAATLDVKGGATVRGNLQSPALGVATATKGFNSNPGIFQASSFNSGTKAAVNQTFQWQAESVANNTATPSGTLNLLFGSGTAAPAETGLKISNKGLLMFAPGQTFPGGSGTVTSVALAAPASDFKVSGSPITGAGRLNLGWTVAPTSANTANAIVKRDSLGNFATNSVTASSLVTSGLTATTISAGSVTTSGDTHTSGTVFGATGNFGAGVSASTQTEADFATGILGEQLALTKAGIGVEGYGNSTHGIGLYGNTFGQSAESVNVAGVFPMGVWGDTSLAGGIGVVATVDDANGLIALNNSKTYFTASFENDDSNGTSVILSTLGPSGQGGLSGACTIDVDGNLTCTGSKSAVVPVDNNTRNVALYAVEAPENWFEDFGSGQLSNGAAVIALESTFRQTVSAGIEYHVFLTPRGECEGLYLANISATSFEVRELHHGSSGVAFDYRIVARRKGYENIRLADKTAIFHNPAALSARKNTTLFRIPEPVATPVRPKAPSLAVR